MSDQGKVKLTRRDFLRSMGLGVGAAAATMAAKPMVGNSIAAKLSSSDPAGRPQRPWWVKTVDQPTTEIDWDKMQRYDNAGTVGKSLGKYIGDEKVAELDAKALKNRIQRIKDQTPGFSIQDRALWDAQMWALQGPRSFLGPQSVKTPEELGVPKWTGTPEEAARMLRTAMRQFGAAHVAFLELNEQTRKLVYSRDSDGREVVFEDVAQAYEDDTKRVIPNSAKWFIVYSVQMSEETLKMAPTHTACQATINSYARAQQIQGITQNFLRALGYQGLGEAQVNGLAIAPALGVLSGLGEMGRHNRLVTPEFGPMVRVFKLITDLPVATDKPIDAGIMEFCKSCKKCAEACPSGALSFENEPFWDIRGGWNNAGHKTWFEDSTKCMAYWKEGSDNNCSICFAVCPFSKKDKAWVHDLVKAGISTVPALDGFYRSMDDAFGYGVQKDIDAWWNSDHPEYGISTDATVKEL